MAEATTTIDGAHAAHDPHHHDGAATLRDLKPIDTTVVGRVAFIALVVGAIAFAGLTVLSMGTGSGSPLRDSFYGYAVGFIFWASPALGSASLLMLGYLTSASWGVVLRRLFQACTRTLPMVALLFCPLAASLFIDHGDQSPYWWSDEAYHGGIDPDTHKPTKQKVDEVAEAKGMRPEAAEEALHKVHDYLTPRGFLIRASVMFVIMGLIINRLNAWSLRAEEHDDEGAKTLLHNLSGPGVVLWVLTMTIMATDWVMSVEPTWASSMFPVVFGMNMFLTALSFCVLVFYSLNLGTPEIMRVVKDKFRIDMGTLLLAITMIWAYSSFSQYMLIWAGNLPEEVLYYRKRGDHGWEYLAYFLMAFHWLVPFLVLLFREVKTNPRVMRFVCLWLLTVCAADVIWWVVPAVERPSSTLHVPLALSAIVMVGGAWGLAFARELAKRPILPANSEGMFLAGWGEHH